MFGVRLLGRFFGSQPEVGESPETVDPEIRPSAGAQQAVDLYSTDGPHGIRVIADPNGATLEYDPMSNHCDDHI